MKTVKRIVLLLIVIITVFTFSSCNLKELANGQIRDLTENMIDACLEGNLEKAYSCAPDAASEKEFAAFFAEISKEFEGIESYELSVLNVNKNIGYDDSEKYEELTAVYLMETDKEDFVIESVTHTGFRGLAGFHIVPYKESYLYSYGTLSNMKGAGLTQWLFLLSNIVLLGIVVYALIDCCKKKIKVKPLWIIIIILCFISFTLTVSDASTHLNFNFGWFFSYTAMILHGDGSSITRIMVPIGAFVYLIFRKALIKKDPPADHYYDSDLNFTSDEGAYTAPSEAENITEPSTTEESKDDEQNTEQKQEEQ